MSIQKLIKFWINNLYFSHHVFIFSRICFLLRWNIRQISSTIFSSFFSVACYRIYNNSKCSFYHVHMQRSRIFLGYKHNQRACERPLIRTSAHLMHAPTLLFPTQIEYSLRVTDYNVKYWNVLYVMPLLNPDTWCVCVLLFSLLFLLFIGFCVLFVKIVGW